MFGLGKTSLRKNKGAPYPVLELGKPYLTKGRVNIPYSVLGGEYTPTPEEIAAKGPAIIDVFRHPEYYFPFFRVVEAKGTLSVPFDVFENHNGTIEIDWAADHNGKPVDEMYGLVVNATHRMQEIASRMEKVIS